MRHSIATTILCASAALALALPTAAAPTNIIASSLRSRDETSNIVELPLAFITGAGSLANEWVAKTNYVTGTDGKQVPSKNAYTRLQSTNILFHQNTNATQAAGPPSRRKPPGSTST